jgi:hypothetical protein
MSRTGSLGSSKKYLKSPSGSQSGSSHCSSCSSLSNVGQTKKIDLEADHEINEVEVVYAKVGWVDDLFFGWIKFFLIN